MKLFSCFCGCMKRTDAVAPGLTAPAPASIPQAPNTGRDSHGRPIPVRPAWDGRDQAEDRMLGTSHQAPAGADREAVALYGEMGAALRLRSGAAGLTSAQAAHGTESNTNFALALGLNEQGRLPQVVGQSLTL